MLVVLLQVLGWSWILIMEEAALLKEVQRNSLPAPPQAETWRRCCWMLSTSRAGAAQEEACRVTVHQDPRLLHTCAGAQRSTALEKRTAHSQRKTIWRGGKRWRSWWRKMQTGSGTGRVDQKTWRPRSFCWDTRSVPAPSAWGTPVWWRREESAQQNSSRFSCPLLCSHTSLLWDSGCTSEGALLLLAPFEGAGKAKKQDKSHICTSTISAALLWISACVDADRTRSRDTFPLTNSGPFCFASPLCIPLAFPIVPFPCLSIPGPSAQGRPC